MSRLKLEPFLLQKASGPDNEDMLCGYGNGKGIARVQQTEGMTLYFLMYEMKEFHRSEYTSAAT